MRKINYTVVFNQVKVGTAFSNIPKRPSDSKIGHFFSVGQLQCHS